MPKTRVPKRPRYTKEQKTERIIRSVYSLEMRGIPATVAAIARDISCTASTRLRQELRDLEHEGVLHPSRQMRLIHIADDTPEWWIDRYGWRTLYSLNLDVTQFNYPDVYSYLAREYGLQMRFPE